MYIYVLIDPRDYRIRYVGKTINPKRRLRGHCTYLKSRSHRTHWLNQLKKENIRPILQVVEKCSESIWSEREMWWISYGRGCGWNLTNTTDGGEGILGYCHTEETREKIRQAHKGNTYTLGRKQTEEHKQNISNSLRGKKKSDEHNKKNSEANKGRIVSDVTRTKMSLSNMGRQRGEYNPRSILTEQKVRDIKWFRARRVKYKDLSKMYGVCIGAIKDVISRKRWGWVEDTQD